MCDAEGKEGEADAELDLWRVTRGGFERRRTGEWVIPHGNRNCLGGTLARNVDRFCLLLFSLLRDKAHCVRPFINGLLNGSGPSIRAHI